MTHNFNLPGPAGETHGIIPVTRSEVRDNSAAALTAMPHPAPNFRPTEAQRHLITSIPGYATQATNTDLTLPHESKSDDPSWKRAIQRRKNSLNFQVAMPVAPAAHTFHHSGDNRHVVLKGGRTGVFTAHGGEIGHGDNASAEMEGGKFNLNKAIRVTEGVGTLGISEGVRAEDKYYDRKAQREANAKQISRSNQNKADAIRAIPADFQPTGGHTKDKEKFKDFITLGTDDAKKKKRKDAANAQLVAQQSDRLKAYQDQQKQLSQQAKQEQANQKRIAKQVHQAQNKQKSKVPQPTAPVNNTPVAPNVEVKQTEAVGGKSKFWRNMAVNLTGIANNVSRAFAENSGEGAGLEPPIPIQPMPKPKKKKVVKKKLKKGGKSKSGEKIAKNLLGTAENIGLMVLEAE